MLKKQTKLGTSFRLTPECRQLLVALAQRLGVSQSDIVELATRQMADREKIRQGSQPERPHD